MNSYFKSRLDVSRLGYKKAAERFDISKACYQLLQLLAKLGIDSACHNDYYRGRDLVDTWHDIYEDRKNAN